MDYAAVYALVEEAVRHRRFYLIEALADHLAEALMEPFPASRPCGCGSTSPTLPSPASSATCTRKRKKKRS